MWTTKAAIIIIAVSCNLIVISKVNRIWATKSASMPVCLSTGEGHDTRDYNKAIFRDGRKKAGVRKVKAINKYFPSLQHNRTNDTKKVNNVWPSSDQWTVPDTHLDAPVGMFLGAQEERAIDQRVTIKDQHRLLAQDTGHAALLVRCQRGQDEQAGLIVAMIALVLNLQWKKKKKSGRGTG